MIEDEVVGTGDRSATYRLGQHPAFGGDLVRGILDVSIAAERVTVHSVHPDHVLTRPRVITSGSTDFSGGFSVRGDFASPRRFLSGHFDRLQTGRATVTNLDNGLGVVLSWDSGALPHAWLWVESGATTQWPWFGQGRVIGIEPCTHPLGARPEDACHIDPGERRVYRVSFTISHDANVAGGCR